MPTALVTGANRGIGLELCRELKRRGYDIIGTSRGPAPEFERDALGTLERLDVSDDESVAALADRLRGTRLDLLVHNAGVLSRETLEDLGLDRIRTQIEVNAVGPLKLTAALIDHLADGARVALLTSRMGSIADNTSGGSYGYRMSKAALNAAGMSLARDLAPRGIAVVLLHPGYVRTAMTGHRGDRDPDRAAAALVDRIEELTLETTGRFVHVDGFELPW